MRIATVALLVCVLLQLTSAQLVLKTASGTVIGASLANIEVSTNTQVYATYLGLTGSATKTFSQSATGPITVSPGTFTISASTPQVVLTWTTSSSTNAAQVTIKDTAGTNPDADVVVAVTPGLKSFDFNKGNSQSFINQDGVTVQRVSAQNVISLTTPLSGGDTVTLVPSGGSVALTPIGQSSFTFSSTVSSIPFTYVGNSIGSNTVSFTVSGSAASQVATPAAVSVTVLPRTIVVSPSTLPQTTVGLQSSTITVSLVDAPPTGLTVKPTITTSDVTFTPAVLTFGPGETSKTFSYKANNAVAGLVVEFVLGGADSALYAQPANLGITTTLRQVSFSGTDIDTDAMVINQPSAPITISLTDAPATGINVDIVASSPNLVLSTQTLTFTPTTLTQSFTVTPTTAETFTLSYSISGADAALYSLNSQAGYLTISGRKLHITVPALPSNLYCGDTFSSSIAIEKPSTGGLTVSLSADGSLTSLAYSPQTVSFGAGQLSVPFSITGTSTIGSGNLYFGISGTDANLFDSLAPKSVSFLARQVNTPVLSTVYASVSAPATLSLNRPTVNGLTVTLSATGVTFTPSTLTFAAGQTSAAFNVLVATPGTYTINYAVAGNDASCFSTSFYTSTFTANPLTLNAPTFISTTVSFGQTSAPIAISIPGLGAAVDVVPYSEPTSAGLTFSPARIALTPANPTGYFTVKSTDTTQTGFTIKYRVENSQAAPSPSFDPSVFTFVGTTSVSFGKIPFILPPFSVAQDAYVGVQSPVQSLVLQNTPTGDVTVQVSAPGIIFNPSVLLFKAGQTPVQTFTYTPTIGDPISGAVVRTVTFTLSGSTDLVSAIPSGQIIVHQRPLDVIGAPLGPVYVGQQFAVTVVASVPPQNGLTLTANGPFTFPGGQTLTMTPPNTAVTFTAIATSVSNAVLTISASGADAPLYQVLSTAGTAINVQTAVVRLSTSNLVTPSLTLNVGEVGYGTITLDVAPRTDLTVVVANNLLTVTPSTFTFGPESSLVQSFTVSPNLNYAALQSFVSSTFTVGISGTDSPNFIPSFTSAFAFSTSSSGTLRTPIVSPPSVSVIMGGIADSPITLNIRDPSTNGVTFTPVVQGHPEITFSPASVTFSAGATTASFLLQGATNYQSNTLTGYFEVSGPDAYVYATRASFGNLAFTVTFTRSTLTFVGAGLGANAGPLYSSPAGTPFTISAGQLSALPSGDVYVTPVVISGPELIFTPSAFHYSSQPAQQVSRLSVLGTAIGTSYVALVVNGSDASWIAAPLLQMTVVIQRKTLTATQSGAPTGKPGDTQIVTITLGSAPTSDLTVRPICAACTISPASVTFSPTSALVQTFTYVINTASVSQVRISYVVSGTDAGSYTALTTTLQTVNPRTITVPTITAPGAGASSTAVVNLDAPAINGVTVTLSAPGYTITNPTLTFAAGESQKTFSFIALAGVANSQAVQVVLSGPDAAWYSTPTVSISNTQATITASAVSTGVGLTANIQLQVSAFPASAAPLVDTITITPVAAGVTFTPTTVTLGPGSSSAVVAATLNNIAVANQNVIVSFTTSGTTFTSAVIAPFTISFPGLTILVPGGFPATNLVVGSTSQAFAIATSALNPQASSQPDAGVTINLYATNGATVNPTSITLSSAQYTSTFTVSPTQVGTSTIYYTLSGNTGAFPTLSGTLGSITAVARTFDFGTDFFTNDVQVGGASTFIYGVKSRMYTVYATVASDATLQLVSDNFDFTPATLSFSSSTTSANFTFVPKKVGRAIISFVVGGTSGPIFTRPTPISINVGYNITIGTVPAVNVGQTSKNVEISILPTPTEPVFVTLPTTDRVYFNPQRVVFTPSSLKSTFTVTGRNPTAVSASGVLATPGYVGLSVVTLGSSASSLVGGIVVRHASEATGFITPLIRPQPVSVKPGLIKVNHPRYQLDVTSHVQFEVSPAPLSDVTVALWGNNLFFDPPFATFTANITKIKVKATPRQTISYEIDNTAFKVEYVCSGTNQLHYFCPTESFHYFAMPRGYVAAIVLVPLFVIILLILAFVFLRGGSKRMGISQSNIALRS